MDYGLYNNCNKIMFPEIDTCTRVMAENVLFPVGYTFSDMISHFLFLAQDLIHVQHYIHLTSLHSFFYKERVSKSLSMLIFFPDYRLF